eukprot:9493045-Heterocapsa_arctica.AAC.1
MGLLCQHGDLPLLLPAGETFVVPVWVPVLHGPLFHILLCLVDNCCCAGSDPGQQRSKNIKMNELKGDGGEGLQMQERQYEAQDEDLQDEDEDNCCSRLLLCGMYSYP